MAYRGEQTDRRPQAPRNEILEEIVHQFADTYAFVRELVQNAIDAGATKIRLLVDEKDGVVFTSVEDDGTGMTLDVIEGPLLTAFASGKEGETGKGKIGKYGVGFLSVFALAPARVVVSTSTTEVGHDVVILPDRSYTIEERAPERRGTIVTLVAGPSATASREEQAKRVEEAARRWCRHVGLPVVLVVDGGAEKVLTEPLGLESPVFVEGEKDGIRAVVGIDAPGVAPAAFYHSGLLLHETTGAPPAIPFVAYKVDSARFQHTISRDGIRADKAYAQAIDLAKRLAKDALVDALRPALDALVAEDATTEADFARAATVVRAAVNLLPRRHVVLPLAVPREGARSLRLGDVGDVPIGSLFTACSRGFVAELLASTGATVLRDDAHGTVRGLVPRARGTERITVLIRAPGAEAFARGVGRALAFAGAAVDGVSVVDVHGPMPARATLLLGPQVRTASGFAGWVLDEQEPVLSLGRQIVLVASAPPIARARIAADAHGAAALVARLVLAEANLANPSSSDRLLRWAADAQEEAAWRA